MEENKTREYCLNCKIKPCSNKGCPLNNDIPTFIHQTDFKKAFEVLSKTTVFPAICGRICPHEKQCQGSCIRGIKGEPVSIGNMEAYIGDISIKENWTISKFGLDDVNSWIYTDIKESMTKKSRDTVFFNNTDYENYTPNITDQQYKMLSTKKVAVIGAGPAGLTCAAFLARCGVQVTIYEKHSELGGILTHGIPEFRLNKTIVEATINKILKLGVQVELNKELGKNISLEELQAKYDAIFVSIGANIPAKMNIQGENLKGVFGGNSLLENNSHPSYIGKNVAVIGGGNVAMDSARTIKRMGAKKVYVIYRRAEEQMPAEKKEIEAAKNEGIEFLFQTNITKILGNCDLEKNKKLTISQKNAPEDKVQKIECIKTQLVKKEGETRLSPVNIEGSNYLMDVDYVVMATGSKLEEEVIKGFEKNKWGYIEVNENMQTSIPKVFAGGDIAGEKATVAWASRSGRNAAANIIKAITNE